MPSAQHHQPDLDAAQATYRPHDYIDALAPLAPYYEGSSDDCAFADPDGVAVQYDAVPLSVACAVAEAVGQLDASYDDDSYARFTLRALGALGLPVCASVDLHLTVCIEEAPGKVLMAPYSLEVPEGPGGCGKAEQTAAAEAAARLTVGLDDEGEELWRMNIVADGVVCCYL